MQNLDEIDFQSPEFGDLYDELPLWSARFGLLLMDQVDLQPGLTILDVGAGTGFLSIELAQRCGRSALVIAVDPWQAAVERLNRKVRLLGLENLRVVTQPAESFEGPDASVDLLVSNLGINNFSDPESTLRNCWRMAKPGAQLLLTTNLVGHMAEFYEVYRTVLTDLGRSDRLALLDAHVQQRATVQSVTQLLQATGFEFVDAVTTSFQERYWDGSALLRHFFIRLGFLPGWKTIAPPEAIETTFAALEERLNRVAAERGGLTLTIPAACIRARKPA